MPRITRIPYWIARFACQCTCFLLLSPRLINLRNVPKKGGVLLVCNHQSFMDPVLAAMDVPREGHYMARDSLFHPKWFGKLLSYLNTYPVKRGTADVGAIKETLRRLKQEQLVLVFPEGTRSPDGRVGPMLAGLATVAKKCSVPIVPVMVDGMIQAWPRDRRFPGFGNAIVEYGKPISPAEYADMTPDDLMAMIRQRIIAMQEQLHRRVPSRRLKWFGT